jgi:hypothetical protein
MGAKKKTSSAGASLRLNAGVSRLGVAGGIVLWLLAPAALGCSSAPETLVLPSPRDVPIELELGGTFMFVQLQIGDSAPFRARLDTGSSGLRMLAGTVSDAAFASITDTPVAYGYGDYDSNLAIYGVVAWGDVTFSDGTTGPLTTASPIPVMLVQTSGCGQAGTCRSLPELFNGAPAILGIGMEGDSGGYGIGNPIAQLPGHPPFVIHVPPDGASPAVLRIGSSPSDSLAFETFQLRPYAGSIPLPNGTPVWNDFGIPSCLQDETSATTYCSGSLWDTGNPTSYVQWPPQPVPYTTVLPAGTAVNVTIGPSTAPMGAYQLIVGAEPEPGADEILVIPAGEANINLGVTLFSHYDALFDQEHGIVGLAQH